MRAFGYLRLSRENDGSTSIDKQEASVRNWCEQHGHELVDVFRDIDVSGTKDSRPDLNRMLERLGDVDLIVFHRLDRIMRSVIGFAKLLERCRTAGVELVSATEPFDTSSAIGRAFVWLLASVAEIEAENTSKRMKATHEHLLAQGKHVGQARTFGWIYDRDTKTLQQDPIEVEIIRRIADDYLAGQGLEHIAADLNQGRYGVTEGAQGGAWTGNQVRRTLSSWRLLGYYVRHGKPATDAPVLPPILDAATFEALQSELRRRQRTATRIRTGRGALTGLLECGVCGDRMYLRGNGRYEAYVCSKRKTHTNAISATHVEWFVFAKTLEYVEQLRLARNAQAIVDSTEPDELGDVRAALFRLKWAKQELMADYYEEQRISRAEFDERLQVIYDRQVRYEEKLAEQADTSGILDWQLARLGDLESAWEEMTQPERRTAFAAVVRKVTVVKPLVRLGKEPSPDRIFIDWQELIPS